MSSRGYDYFWTVKVRYYWTLHPIVFIRTDPLPYWSEDSQHAVVVSGYDETHLWLNDPAFPDAPQKVLTGELMLAWDEFDNAYALLIH